MSDQDDSGQFEDAAPRPRGPRPAEAPKASTVKYKAALRREIRRRKKDPEVDYLNITAMLDLMTIILVFLLQSMASSAASIQENDDLRLARSVMQGEPSDQGVVLTISKSAILLGEDPDPVVKLPGREQLATTGLDAQFKRSGPSDLYIVPLARRLENARKLDKAVRAAKGQPANTSEAIILADASTPYRLLIEVLYTLGQSEFGKYHLLVMKKKT
ncbi:MAG: biopolymer transporter ExbD [Deltaproteobacteria bacterium]|nr:biopolymer transporter ExbD [Deltaproteobacteria bacterium]